MILVDTNVLLDVVTDDPVWAHWSVAQLENTAIDRPVLINDVVYAELAARYARIEQLDAFVAEAELTHVRMPKSALFLAAKVFAQYRSAGGQRGSVLPDFCIGAPAAVEGLSLLTRDVGRYRSYFPNLHVIAPDP
ncbi:type II toxin-antitoxin system VapC family toxin [Rhizobium glycinendophyticum]|uniref:Type II toxin-antitoxin system VapC family toxin n=1 Tax=Rhizobium glycinendophyticum TaxID=2589807 RepID=A0A504TX37_9HYPH|nr:type II toxin-antitoxin system VapC family toxin [Rhizobium glycinendophyticum]TPP05957.1 type II toxin-antitoxin system VapC family toxin [Rhizobium glycinendophyticum]